MSGPCCDEEALALQLEEAEVLKSIYEGDTAFAVLEEGKKYQYKFGDQSAESGGKRALLLEVAWTPGYPNRIPLVNLDAFYNRHVRPDVKASIVDAITKEADQYLGMSMTYSLFEYVKENFESLLTDQPDAEVAEAVEHDGQPKPPVPGTGDGQPLTGNLGGRKEQLTKAQKRRMWDKGGLEATERPRGWDWVDVIRHLSQTGSQQPQ